MQPDDEQRYGAGDEQRQRQHEIVEEQADTSATQASACAGGFPLLRAGSPRSQAGVRACGRFPQAGFQQGAFLLHLLRCGVLRHADRRAGHVHHAAEREGEHQFVPTPQPAVPRRAVRGRIDGRPGSARELQRAGLGPFPWPARPVGHHDQIGAAAVRRDHALEAADPAARRRPADRHDAEPAQDARHDLAVAVPAVHDAGPAAAIREPHQHDPAVPERQDDPFPAAPAGEQLVRPHEARADADPQPPQRGRGQPGPQPDFQFFAPGEAGCRGRPHRRGVGLRHEAQAAGRGAAVRNWSS